MPSISLRSRAVGALILMLLAAGCGSNDLSTQAAASKDAEPEDGPPSSPPTFSRLSTFEEVVTSVQYDVQYAANSRQLLEFSTLAVDGEFESLEAGRSSQSEGIPGASEFVVATIKVNRLFKGELLPVEDGRIYLEIPSIPGATIEDLRKVFPVGERVTAALVEWDPAPQPSGVTQRGVDAGRPDGARLMSWEYPGLFFTEVDGTFTAPFGAVDSNGRVEVTTHEEVVSILTEASN